MPRAFARQLVTADATRAIPSELELWEHSARNLTDADRNVDEYGKRERIDLADEHFERIVCSKRAVAASQSCSRTEPDVRCRVLAHGFGLGFGNHGDPL